MNGWTNHVISEASNIKHDVLVVDDEPDAVDSVRLILEPAGYLVRGHLSCQEAIQSIRKSPPSIVLLDLRMPGMDGFDFLETVHPEFPDLPVAVLTALPDSHYVSSRLEKFGHMELLSKPVRPEDLLNLLKRHYL